MRKSIRCTFLGVLAAVLLLHTWYCRPLQYTQRVMLCPEDAQEDVQEELTMVLTIRRYWFSAPRVTGFLGFRGQCYATQDVMSKAKMTWKMGWGSVRQGLMRSYPLVPYPNEDPGNVEMLRKWQPIYEHGQVRVLSFRDMEGVCWREVNYVPAWMQD